MSPFLKGVGVVLFILFKFLTKICYNTYYVFKGVSFGTVRWKDL